MKHCPKCGAKMHPDDTFCAACGHKLSDDGRYIIKKRSYFFVGLISFFIPLLGFIVSLLSKPSNPQKARVSFFWSLLGLMIYLSIFAILFIFFFSILMEILGLS